MIRHPWQMRPPRAPFSGKKIFPSSPKATGWDPGALQAALNDIAAAGVTDASWYNYRPGAQGIVNPAGFQYLPMFFLPNQVTDANILQCVTETGPNAWWLYLNEPDLDGVTVADGVTGWQNLVTHPLVVANNIQFVGPAPTDTGGPNNTSTWLANWIAGIAALNLPIPLVLARHAYTNTAAVFASLTLYQRTYAMNPYWLAPYRFWLTECGPGSDLGVAGNEAFMKTVYRSLVARTFKCDRMAWWSMSSFNLAGNGWRTLYNADGTPTAIGTYWNNLTLATL